MTSVTKEYKNSQNGGMERVTRDGDSYVINSYINGVGWVGPRSVSRKQVAGCMEYTNAPSDVVIAILGSTQ